MSVAAVLSRWPLVVLVALPFTLGIARYAQQQPTYYAASTVVAFQPRGETSLSSDLFRAVLPRYVAYLASGDTDRRVQTSLGERPDETEVGVVVEVPADTANLNITARRGRPEQAAEVANAFAAAVLEYNRRDTLLVAQQVAPALSPRTPAGPRRKQFYAAGLLAGLVLGLGFAVLLERWRPRVRLSDEIVEGVRVLGRFPEALPSTGEKRHLRDLVSGPGARVLTAQAVAAGGPLAKVLGVATLRESVETSVVAAALAAGSVGAGRSVLLVVGSTEGEVALALDMPAPARKSGFPDPAAGAGLRSRATPVPGLRLVVPPVGGWSDRELLAAVESAQRTADLVVVDCPPLGALESQALVAAFEEVVLVAPRHSPTADVRTASLLLQRLGVPARGVVLTPSHLGRARVRMKQQAPT